MKMVEVAPADAEIRGGEAMAPEPACRHGTASGSGTVAPLSFNSNV